MTHFAPESANESVPWVRLESDSSPKPSERQAALRTHRTTQMNKENKSEYYHSSNTAFS